MSVLENMSVSEIEDISDDSFVVNVSAVASFSNLYEALINETPLIVQLSMFTGFIRCVLE